MKSIMKKIFYFALAALLLCACEPEATYNAKGETEKDFYGNPISTIRQLKGCPIEPSEEEQNANSRSRSAKLRIAVKI